MANDSWFGVDKLQHFVLSALVTAIVYFGAIKAEVSAQRSLILAGCISVLAGLTKELGDYFEWWPGLVSARDIGADLIGTTVALSGLVVYTAALARRPEALARSRLVALYDLAAEP